MTVVLNAGGGGVLFHEACGHGLEADAIGKDTTVYARTRGDKMGSELFSGVDDPTVPGGWGSYGFDDEGTAATRTTLFDHGVQAGVMSDRISAHRLGTVSTGHGRRQSYAHVPLPRMSNSSYYQALPTPRRSCLTSSTGCSVLSSAVVRSTPRQVTLSSGSVRAT